MSIERSLGLAFETLVTGLLIPAGNEEREHAIANNITFDGMPACIVVMDAGWNR